MFADRRVAATGAGLVLALVAAAGCAAQRPTTHEPDAKVTICGQVLLSGASVPQVRTPVPPSGHAPPAPTGSVLPATYSGPEPGLGALRVVRLAPGCTEGATVLVTPTDSLRTRTTVRAPDGTLIALVLVHLTDSPAILYAYRNGKATGELTV